jgi:hypothetical protein
VAGKFVEEASRYGWQTDERWENLVVPGNRKRQKKYKVPRNIEGDDVGSPEYRAALRKIKTHLTRADTRAVSYFGDDKNFDERYKINPLVRRDGKALTIDEIYHRIDKADIIKIMHDLDDCIEVYHRVIGFSGNSSSTSKEMLLSMRAAQTQLEFIDDLARLHARYYVRETFPESRRVVQELYGDMHGGDIGNGILLAAYCSCMLIDRAARNLNLLQSFGIKEIKSPGFNPDQYQDIEKKR